MTAVSRISRRLEGPTVLGALARVWLSLLLFLQLVGFAVGAAPPAAKASDLAALSQAVGSGVTLCRHGGDGSSRHDDGSGHGDCGQLGACRLAHQDFALVPTIVAAAPRSRFDSRRDLPTTLAVRPRPLLAATFGPRGPPSQV